MVETMDFEDGSRVCVIGLGRLEFVWSIRGPRPRNGRELARNGVQIGRLSVLWGR